MGSGQDTDYNALCMIIITLLLLLVAATVLMTNYDDFDVSMNAATIR